MNRPYDPTRGADSESGKTFVPDAVRDQFIEDAKDEVYFDKKVILDHVADCRELGQFAVDVMEAFFDYMDKPVSPGNHLEFAAIVREKCQQLRNDTTDYVVRNA
jgi:hypothetical protein